MFTCRHAFVASIGALACSTVFAMMGCSTDAAAARTVSTNPLHLEAAPTHELYAQLDAIYDKQMKPLAEKCDPIEKQIVEKLNAGDTDVKDLVTKNHQVFADAIAKAPAVIAEMSKNTGQVPVSEHDTYVAFYTGVTQKVTTRRDEYISILALEKKIDKDTVATVLMNSRTVQGNDLSYMQAKR